MKALKRKPRARARARPPIAGLIDRLREVIESQGSTCAVAKAINRSEGTLRKWLRGESEPSASDIRRLCEASGHSVEWFLFGTDLNGRCERENRTHPGGFRLVAK